MSKNVRLIRNIIIALSTIIIVIAIEDRTVTLHQINNTVLMLITIISYIALLYLLTEKRNPIGALFILPPILYLGGTLLSVVLKYSPAFTVISGELLGLAIITIIPILVWTTLEEKFNIAIIASYIFTVILFALLYAEERLYTIDNILWSIAIILGTILVIKKNLNYKNNNALYKEVIQELYGDVLQDIRIKKENNKLSITAMHEEMIVEIIDNGELTYYMKFNTGVMKRFTYNDKTRNNDTLSFEQNSIFKNYTSNFTGRKSIIVEPTGIKLRFREELNYNKLFSSLNYKRRIGQYNSQLTAAMKLTQVI